MNNYLNILVVIDPATEDQKALKRALFLAKLTQAKLSVLLSIYDFSYEMTSILSGEEREAMRASVIKSRELWLDNIIAKENIHEQEISTKVVWQNRPFESIILEVIEKNYDLVIKATHEHDKLKSVIFTPTDWHILRKCPCPILLVKDHDWPEKGNIVAALNIGSDEVEHQSLNQEITLQSLSLAKLINADVHLVNSFPGAPINVAIEFPEFNTLKYYTSMKNHHDKAMKEHADKFSISDKFTHVEEGLPEDVISTKAQSLDAELVVLGCIGRTGISAALIGNTAEHVIDQLNCDLLALKPKGFISPLA